MILANDKTFNVIKIHQKNASLWVKMMLDCLENGNETVARIGVSKLSDSIPQGVSTISNGERTYIVHRGEDSVANWTVEDLRAYLVSLNK